MSPSTDSPRAWLVGLNSVANREQKALDEGLAILGWHKVGDLRKFDTRDSLQENLAKAYPQKEPAVIEQWASQLFQFKSWINDGDFVVMRHYQQPNHVAIGRIAGPYEYRRDESRGYRHTRKVEWIRQDVPLNSFQPDLQKTLNSNVAIAPLNGNDAARRIAEFVRTGDDPGDQFDPHSDPQTLLDEALKYDPQSPLTLTIRAFLQTWGFQRRTHIAIAIISQDLADRGLTTQPAFTDEALDVDIALVPLSPEDSGDRKEESPQVAPPRMKQHLKEIATTVASVAPTDSLKLAKTRMLQHDYSQLAVIDEEGGYEGALSWESIAKVEISNPEVTLADAIFFPDVVDHDSDLHEESELVVKHNFVLVRDSENRVTGIVTAADLSNQFRYLVQPFIDIEEAEVRLRSAVAATFSAEEIQRAFPNGRRKIKSAADLTFGNYGYLLKEPEMWRKLGWHIDQEEFLNVLGHVRQVRNDLMHFSPDPVPDEEQQAIAGLLRLLRTAVGDQ